MIPSRRDLIGGCAAIAAASFTLRPARGEDRARFRALASLFGQLEKRHGGRLGVAVLDTATGERSGYRQDERFAMCSTVKTLLAAAVLQRVDQGDERLDRTLAVPAAGLVSHSPLTGKHAGGSMTIEALCHAAVAQSDNTATNLLLTTIGGPSGVTRFARSIGDKVTRLDRLETELNEAKPGDPRDTTSPAAMTNDLQALLLGVVLSAASRERLTRWMIENQYGLTRLRAAVPKGWRAADKTGSNGSTTSNDAAVYWPPERAAVIVSAYLTECPGPETNREAALAEVGRLVVSALGTP